MWSERWYRMSWTSTMQIKAAKLSKGKHKIVQEAKGIVPLIGKQLLG